MPDGEFVPEPGSKIIRFEEYQPGQDPGCIWNLSNT